MDSRTGKIYNLTDPVERGLVLALSGLGGSRSSVLTAAVKAKNCVPDVIQVSPVDMTKKQQATNQVSKHDTKSKLGKIFTGNRKQRRQSEQEWKRENKKSNRTNPRSNQKGSTCL